MHHNENNIGNAYYDIGDHEGMVLEFHGLEEDRRVEHDDIKFISYNEKSLLIGVTN